MRNGLLPNRFYTHTPPPTHCDFFSLSIKSLAVLQLNPVVHPTEAKVIRLMHMRFGQGSQVMSEVITQKNNNYF